MEVQDWKGPKQKLQKILDFNKLLGEAAPKFWAQSWIQIGENPWLCLSFPLSKGWIWK